MTTIRELVTKIRFTTDKTSLNKAENSVRNLAGKMRDIGKTMTFGLTLPVIGFGTSILRTSANFETAMNQIEVKSGATAKEMELLENKAEDLGATTSFSATDAANAMGFLAQAGFKTNQIMEAIEPSLNLAAASGQDLATTADQLSNIMQAYALQANEAGRASDVLAKTASSTNTNVTQLAEAMKFSAPIAKEYGMTFEETAAITGMLGNAGIQGSMAGTALRTALVRLSKPTTEVTSKLAELGIQLEENGKRRNFLDILADLQGAGAKVENLGAIFGEDVIDEVKRSTAELGDVATIFGTEAVSGISSVLGQGVNNVKDLAKDLESSTGEAKKQADTTMKGLNGAFLAFKSAVEALSLALGDSGLTAAFTVIFQKLASFVRWMSKTNPTILSVIVSLAGLLAIMGPLAWLMGTLTLKVPMILKGFSLMWVAVTKLTFVLKILGAILGFIKTVALGLFAAVLTPLGLVLTSILGLVAAMFYFRDSIAKSFPKLGKWIDWALEKLQPLIKGFKAVGEFFGFGGGDAEKESNNLAKAGRDVASSDIAKNASSMVNNSNKNQVSLNNNVNINAAGAGPEQVKQIEDSTRRIIREENERALRHLQYSNPALEG